MCRKPFSLFEPGEFAEKRELMKMSLHVSVPADLPNIEYVMNYENWIQTVGFNFHLYSQR